MSGQDLDELLEAKSKELKDLQRKKIDSLNQEISTISLQLAGCRDQYNELKESFEFNLNLLKDRDDELEKYDSVITELNSRINSYMVEISDIKVS